MNKQKKNEANTCENLALLLKALTIDTEMRCLSMAILNSLREHTHEDIIYFKTF